MHKSIAQNGKAAWNESESSKSSFGCKWGAQRKSRKLSNWSTTSLKHSRSLKSTRDDSWGSSRRSTDNERHIIRSVCNETDNEWPELRLVCNGIATTWRITTLELKQRWRTGWWVERKTIWLRTLKSDRGICHKLIYRWPLLEKI